MKKVLSIILALALICVAFAACGNGETSSPSSSEPSESAQDSSVAEESSEASESSAEPAGEVRKIGILAPAVTHGWVAGVAYNAEQRCEELQSEGKIEYKFYTSNNAEEMTTQLDDLKSWGAEAIVAYPQWEGMEVPIQQAIDEGIVVVNFDIEIAADGVYRVSGDNESMGVEGANRGDRHCARRSDVRLRCGAAQEGLRGNDCRDRAGYDGRDVCDEVHA